MKRLARCKPAPIGHSAIKGALVRALTTGGAKRTGPLSINWDVAGTGKYRCLTPAKRTVNSDQGADSVKILGEKERPRSYLDLTMRCRKCEHCLKLRALNWTARAKAEIDAWPRTWFGTLTLRPDMHLRCEQFARVALGRSGGDWDSLTVEEQFAERHKVISSWLTLWVKRIRKSGGGNAFRIMMVCEKHKTGLPHYHLLLHEMVAFATQERELRHQWFYGFSKFVLVDKGETGKAAWYVAKYLSKETSARVRASVSYGEALSALQAKDLRSVTEDQISSPPRSMDENSCCKEEK